MDKVQQPVEICLHISAIQAERLRRFSATHHANEDAVVEQALDIFFRLTELLDAGVERKAWSDVSDGALGRVWDNDDDAIYDDWRELYGVPAG